MRSGGPAGPDSKVSRRHIVLIGAMAVGKSAIGQELARTLQREFVDTDQLIVSKHGSIARIFAGRGELFFRDVEAKTVATALEAPTQRPLVISLGGGAVLDSGTQQLLAAAWVVHLDADLDTVRERIRRNTGRPLLSGDPMQRWEQMARTRFPVYQRLADVTLDVRQGSVPNLVAELVRLIPAEPAASGPDSRRGSGNQHAGPTHSGPEVRNPPQNTGSDSRPLTGPKTVPEDGQQ